MTRLVLPYPIPRLELVSLSGLALLRPLELAKKRWTEYGSKERD